MYSFLPPITARSRAEFPHLSGHDLDVRDESARVLSQLWANNNGVGNRENPPRLAGLGGARD
jgi:hypothetical protein